MGAAGAPCEWLPGTSGTTPGGTAVVDPSGTLDHRGLMQEVDALAVRLAALFPADHAKMRPPLLALPASEPALLVRALHAAPRAGWALLPYDPAMPEARWSALLERTDPEGVAGPRQWRPERCVDTAFLRGDGPPLPTEAGMGRALAAEAVHLVVETSGTSGAPKAAMLTGINLAAAAEAAQTRLGLTGDDLWLDCLPLNRIGGLAVPYRCAAAGAGLLLHDGFDADRVWRDLNAYPVSHLSVVPAMLHRLLEAAEGAPPPASLRGVLVGGGPLSEALCRRAQEAGWPLCPSYGMTETCAQTAVICAAGGEWRAGRVGHPLPGMECRIIDPDAEGIGRIRLRGPQVMAGYANPEGEPGRGLETDGAFETGDLGRLDPDAGLSVVGRADEVLVSGGVNVHPVPVETVLAGCPGVEAAALTARTDPVWGECLVAVYAGAAPAGEVEQWCRRHLQGAQRPRAFLRVGSLPCTDAGKLDRAALRALVVV